MTTPRKIRKLDETVVNRIAAGEIIQRPANALKELIENSLDAKATNIQVSVKEGGMKLLQIQDNGTGIRKDDLDIVCERFTTSKLQTFDDLKSISTFGFRGEALASISHVAHLTITTKTANEKCAYKASYLDGKLKEPPTRCAGNQGTIITVENLFYNVATRRKALNSPSEELSKINEVVTRYAVHNPSVGFTLKKYGEAANLVRTPHSSTNINNIRLLFGNNIAKELLEVKLDDARYKFKLHALVTNANYSGKRMMLLLFINHRLVDSSAIKKTLEDIYSVYLPKKAHPWCYISLEIEPQNVDVNVHPTKYEVRFLHEEAIIEKIKISLDEKLASNDASRTFYIQAKLPQVNITEEVLEENLPGTQEQADKDKTKKVHPKDMIRTSSSDQKLDKFNFTINKNDLENPETEKNKICDNETMEKEACKDKDPSDISTDSKDASSTSDNPKYLFDTSNATNQSEVTDKTDNKEHKSKSESLEKKAENHQSSQINKNSDKQETPVGFKSYSVNEIQVETKLLSILTLRKEVEDNFHEGLRESLSNLIFVGCVDDCSALIQSGVKLYMCNTQKLVEELFYQIMLYDFANYGVIKFSEPIPIYELALLGLEHKEAGWSQEDGDKKELAMNVKELLLEKADMLKQYFSIYIDKNGNLKSLPYILEKYFPSPGELPLYILRLSTEVNWSKEKPCFRAICRETARFYSKVDTAIDSWKSITEHVLYNTIKESLLPPPHFLHDSTILEIASLPNLYKVFERC
ncbi:mutL homolog 1 [Nasonia vitripennis]|uniref:DNA mismatch repair protein MLH1 n=1 Tax=Nasonia vitripennis TaxID=7425 RepID=A0A7M6UVD4_NASVI|nr:mutL homolog 1 [Nasonia vitripennis]